MTRITTTLLLLHQVMSLTLLIRSNGKRLSSCTASRFGHYSRNNRYYVSNTFATTTRGSRGKSACAFFQHCRGGASFHRSHSFQQPSFGGARMHTVADDDAASTTNEMKPANQTNNPVGSICIHKDTEPLLELKRQALLRGGLRDLHVVIDFDHTITAAYTSSTGEKCLECHDIIHQIGNSHNNEDEMKDPRWGPFRHEIDELWAASRAGLLPGGLQEWWETFHAKMIEHGFTRAAVAAAVRTANTELRPGARELMEFLAEHHVQTTIVSAGIFDVIHECFVRKFGIRLWDEAVIVANTPLWGSRSAGDSSWTNGDEHDDDRLLVGWKEPVIHSRNKAEALNFLGVSEPKSNKDSPQNQSPPSNILLVGNSIGDAACLQGIYHNNSLAFSFCNENVSMNDEMGYNEEEKAKVDAYLDHYDVVILGKHSDFSHVLDFLHQMEQEEIVP